MKLKLTLRIEEELIEKIKKFSKEKGYSVSKLVESYFKFLTREEKEELIPTVKKLKGLIKNKNVKEKEHKKHLHDKYL